MALRPGRPTGDARQARRPLGRGDRDPAGAPRPDRPGHGRRRQRPAVDGSTSGLSFTRDNFEGADRWPTTHPDDEMIEIGDPTDGRRPRPPGGPSPAQRGHRVPRARRPLDADPAPADASRPSSPPSAITSSALRPEPRPSRSRRPEPGAGRPPILGDPAPHPAPRRALPNPAPNRPRRSKPADPRAGRRPRPSPPTPSRRPRSRSKLPRPPSPSPRAPTFPRVVGLGFDPEGLKAEAARAEAPVDPAVAPAGESRSPSRCPRFPSPRGPGRRRPSRPEPAPARPHGSPASPPAAADRRGDSAEAEDDRFRFHAELEAICRKQGRPIRPRNRSRSFAKPTGWRSTRRIKKRAAKPPRARPGQYAGRGRATARPINILREEGFPEPAILHDHLRHRLREAYLVRARTRDVKEFERGRPRRPRSVRTVQKLRAGPVCS